MTLTYDEFAQYISDVTLFASIKEEGRDYADNQKTIPAFDEPPFPGCAHSRRT
jgi:hypothetical protein